MGQVTEKDTSRLSKAKDISIRQLLEVAYDLGRKNDKPCSQETVEIILKRFGIENSCHEIDDFLQKTAIENVVLNWIED